MTSDKAFKKKFIPLVKSKGGRGGEMYFMGYQNVAEVIFNFWD